MRDAETTSHMVVGEVALGFSEQPERASSLDGFALVTLQVHHAVRARELAAADGLGPLRPAVGHQRHHVQADGTNLVVVAEKSGQVELRRIAPV